MHTPFMDKSPHRRDRESAGGRLKQRLARILTRSTCTTDATSAGSGGGGTAFVSLAKSHPREPEAPPSPYFCTPCTHDRPKAIVDGCGTRPHRRRHRSASLVHISVDCTGGAAGAVSGRRSVNSDAPLLQHLSVPANDVVKKQSKQGGSRGRSNKPPPARSPSASRRHFSSSSSSWGRARRPSSTPTPCSYSWSSSSSTATDDDELAPFSGSDEDGGDEAETRTLFSFLSFSSDSTPEFYHTNGGGGGGNIARRSHRNTMSRRRHRRAPRRVVPRTSGDPAPPPDVFRPLVSVETKKQHRECDEGNKEEKGRNKEEKDRLNVKTKLMTAGAAAEEETGGGGGGAAGMAVVKRSSNPYLDFRSSMVEMVVERRICSVGKMEDLLGSYLSLNSPRHHPAILAAFEDVWEAVFGEE